LEEQKFRSNYGNTALILFVALSMVLVLTAYYEQEWHLYLFYPFFFFLFPFIYHSYIVYSLSTTQLILNEPFNKKRIDFSKISEVEILEHKKWVRFLYGQPKIYVLLKYNKYDEMHVYPKFPEKFKEALLNNLEEDKEINT